MLITHGKADRRTPLAGAKKFVSALEKTDVDFEHFFYGKEGHGLYFDKNSMDQFQKSLKNSLPNVIKVVKAFKQTFLIIVGVLPD